MHVKTLDMTDDTRLVTVSLSRTNLEGLLRELVVGSPVIRKRIGDTALLVIAEEDEVHYKNDRYPHGGLGL